MDLLKRIMEKVNEKTDAYMKEDLVDEINTYEATKKYLAGPEYEIGDSSYGLYLMGSKEGKKLA